MAFIELVDENDAPGAAAARERLGYVPNYARLFAHRPAVYDAWRALLNSITSTMPEQRYELATLAAARQLRSSYCALAHGRVVAERFLSPEIVRDLAVDRGRAAIDEADAAVMDFAAKVADDATAITAADVDRLRELGLADAEILDVALAAAARCFFSKTLDALGVQPDAALAGLEPELRDALTVGRPIALA